MPHRTQRKPYWGHTPSKEKCHPIGLKTSKSGSNEQIKNNIPLLYYKATKRKT